MECKVKDIPEELMQHIQSHLPVKEATRTSVLSKSWLHAYSTNRTLRFHFVRGKKNIKLVKYVERTLTRYLRDNIPIEKFDLEINITNHTSASHAKKWIQAVATKTYNCLKEFSLSVTLDNGASDFTLPDELLLGEKLTTITVRSFGDYNSAWMMTSHHPMIKCVSLRELHLVYVQISEEALNAILSSCTLLVKIQLTNLDSPNGFKTIKVKNLSRLYELSIALNTWHSPALEICDVPNLRVFKHDISNSNLGPWETSMLPELPDPLPLHATEHSMSLSNVTQLELRGVVPDNACLDMITSRFPLLESLTLHLTTWEMGSFHFTCASIKIFSLQMGLHKKLSDVHIYAPKLHSFSFLGDDILPNLLFPVSSSLTKIELSIILNRPVDASFFLKMREALTLLPKCNIRIITCNNSRMPLDIDINDLRRRPPATNVQQLEFNTFCDKCNWERSPFFDAFFEICHPKHVFAKPDRCGSSNREFRYKNHFCRLLRREVLEKKNTTLDWPHQLENVLIRRLPHKKWKTLKSYRRRFLHGSAPFEFKLNWY